MDPNSNVAPKLDQDCVDEFPTFGAGTGLGALGPPRVRQDVDQEDTKRKRKKNKRGQSGSKDGSGGYTDEMLALASRDKLNRDKFGLPSRNKGEKEQAYKARCNKALKEQMASTRKKLSTERHQDKKREHRQTKRKRIDEKRIKKEIDQAQPVTKKAAFRDIVERPPILSDKAMRSKEKATGKLAVRSSTNTAIVSGGFENYANKVKAAYDELRQKRLAAAEAAANR